MEEFNSATADKKEDLAKEVKNLQDALKKSIETFEEEMKN